MSVRMRHTKAHTGNRRSHHSLKGPQLSRCSHCDAWHIRHKACLECGYYRGRMVIDITKKLQKQEARRLAQAETKQADQESANQRG